MNMKNAALLLVWSSALPGTALADLSDLVGKYKVDGVTINVLPMPLAPEVQGSVAYDINNNGDIVGAMSAETAEYTTSPKSPFIHMDGQTYSLLPGEWIEADYVAATSINDARVVVGYYEDWTLNPPRIRPFYYFPGVWMSPMITDPINDWGRDWKAWAFAINNSNFVVGKTKALGNVPPSPAGLCAETPTRWDSYELYPAAFMCPSDPDSNGTISGQGLPPAAYDVNDSNEVVGTDAGTTAFSMYKRKNPQTAYGQHIAVPAPAGLAQVGPGGVGIKGIASGINNHGWVVGTWGIAAGTITGGWPSYLVEGVRAFVWNGVSAASEAIPMVTYGIGMEALKINDQRMVAGNILKTWSSSPDGDRRRVAFIWHSSFGTLQLPPLAYSAYLKPLECRANSLNNRKSTGLVQVVGFCRDSEGHAHAVRWDINVSFQVSSGP